MLHLINMIVDCKARRDIGGRHQAKAWSLGLDEHETCFSETVKTKVFQNNCLDVRQALRGF